MFFSLINNSKFPLKIHCNEEDVKNPFTTDLYNIFFIRRNNTMINNPNTSIYRHIILRHHLMLNKDICFHSWYHKKKIKLKITFHIRVWYYKI